MRREVVAVPRGQAFNPALVREPATVTYNVRSLVCCCNAVSSASYVYLGTGWTRVTVARREEDILRHCLDLGHYDYVKQTERVAVD